MKILITGGLGFIGFNLALHLSEAGHNIIILDSCNPDTGYNNYHLDILKKHSIKVIIDTIGNAEKYKNDFDNVEIVFNFASLIGHMMSVKRPLNDLEQNTVEHIKFLEFLKELNPRKIIYSSTRQIYGRQEKIPVNEKQCVNPVDFNGISKYSTELYHRVYAEIYNIKLIVLRITNVYGPAMYIKDSKLSFMGWFINRVLTGNNIEIYGSGKQCRDLLYIDDLICTMENAIDTEFTGIVNLGNDKSYTLNEITEEMCKFNNEVKVIYKEFPKERKKIDIGSFSTDSLLAKTKLEHNPRIDLEKGIEKTLNYFNELKGYYL